jgi:PleD family two-component response regulator
MVSHTGQKRILVLDKGGKMLPVIEEIMAYGDFDIHLMDHPESVVSRAKELMPDLVILDYLQVNGDCPGICRRLKEGAQLHDIAVILVAGYVTKKMRSHAYQCDALFVNTLDMDALAPRISYLMAS